MCVLYKDSKGGRCRPSEYYTRRERCPLLTPFYEKLHITDTVSVIIISIALMLICGFAATRVTKLLRLPNVTAYIVAAPTA